MAEPKGSGDGTPPPSLVLAVLLTGLVSFGPVSTDLYLPSLPALTRVFGADVAMVQLTLSVFIAGFAVAQLVYGPLSDRYGRRPVLIGGILVYVGGSLLCLFAPSIEALIAGRFLQALGACSGPVVGRAVVRDVWPPRQAARVLSYMASAMALAPMAAPILGGWAFSLWGWRSNFVILVVFGLVLLLGVLRLLAETNRHRDPLALRPARMLRTYGLLLRDRRFLGHVLTLSLAFSGLFAFISGSSFVLIEVLGLAPRHFGFAFAAVVFGYVTGTFISGRLSERVGVDALLTAGTTMGVAAALLLAGLAWAEVHTLAAAVAPMSLYFVSVGLVLPNATAAALMPFPRNAGVASALMGFVQMATGATVGAAVGWLHDGTPLPMAAVILASALAAFVAHRGLTARG